MLTIGAPHMFTYSICQYTLISAILDLNQQRAISSRWSLVMMLWSTRPKATFVSTKRHTDFINMPQSVLYFVYNARNFSDMLLSSTRKRCRLMKHVQLIWTWKSGLKNVWNFHITSWGRGRCCRWWQDSLWAPAIICICTGSKPQNHVNFLYLSGYTSETRYVQGWCQFLPKLATISWFLIWSLMHIRAAPLCLAVAKHGANLHWSPCVV